ncbi:MAG: hypothetical protein WCT04_12505 [Planctomycetota bacterium]
MLNYRRFFAGLTLRTLGIAGFFAAMLGGFHLFGGERCVIALVDVSGSMNSDVVDPESGPVNPDTKQNWKRIELTWKYLQHDFENEILQGNDGLRIFVLPFSNAPTAEIGVRTKLTHLIQIPTASVAEMKSAFNETARTHPPGGGTDIVWALEQVVTLVQDPTLLQIAPETRFDILIYSDGQHNAFRPGVAEPVGDAAKKKMLTDDLNNAYKKLYGFFCANSSKMNLSCTFKVKYWFDTSDPVEQPPVPPVGCGNVTLTAGIDLDNPQPAKVVLRPLQNLTAVMQSDGGALISGRWSALLEHVEKATMDVRLGAPFETISKQFDFIAGTKQRAQSDDFKLLIPASEIKQKSWITINAQVRNIVPEGVQHRQKPRTIENGPPASDRVYVGPDAHIEFSFPMGGVYRDILEMTLGENFDIPVQLRWNTAAEKIPLTLSSPDEWNASYFTGDMKPLPSSAFTLAQLYPDVQTGRFILRFKPQQRMKSDHVRNLVQFTAASALQWDKTENGQALGSLAAKVSVLPKSVYFEGENSRKIELDPNQQTVVIPVLHVKPGPGTVGRAVSIHLINRTGGKLKADLFLDGSDKPFSGTLQLKESAFFSIRLQGEHAALLAYVPDSIRLDCGVATGVTPEDKELNPIFGSGFILVDPPGQLPLKTTFTEKPSFNVKLTLSDGTELNPDKSIPVTEGNRVRIMLLLDWNDAAENEKLRVDHPFRVAMPLGQEGTGQAELDLATPFPQDLILAKTLPRQWPLNLIGIKRGAVSAGKVRFQLQGYSPIELAIPKVDVAASDLGFKAQLIGKDGQQVDPKQPILLAFQETLPFKIQANWLDPAVGRKVTHPLGGSLDYDYATLKSDAPFPADWVLSEAKVQTIPLSLAATKVGRCASKKLEFSINGDSAYAHIDLPEIVVYEPTLAMNIASVTCADLLPDESMQFTLKSLDKTVPALSEGFWKQGGLAEAYDVVLSPKDNFVQFVFAESGTERARLSSFKSVGGASPETEVRMTYKGPRKVVGEILRDVPFTVALVAHADAGKVPPIQIDGGGSLPIRVPGRVHTGFIALFILVLVIGAIAVIATRSTRKVAAPPVSSPDSAADTQRNTAPNQTLDAASSNEQSNTQTDGSETATESANTGGAEDRF